MKIGYPAAGKDEQRMFFSKDFVECGQIGIYNLEDNSIALTQKEEIKMGLLQWLKENNIEAIVTPELAPMALNVFREENIKVYKSHGTLLQLNIELFKTGELELLSFGTVKEGTSCNSGSCSSCSSCS